VPPSAAPRIGPDGEIVEQLIPLPPSTLAERVAAYEAYLPRSPLLRREARALLAAKYAAQLEKGPWRDLYAAERAARGNVERAAALQAEWALQHEINVHELRETRERQLLLDNEARVAGFSSLEYASGTRCARPARFACSARSLSFSIHSTLSSCLMLERARLTPAQC
jgi:hypothetical protein